MHHCHYEDNFVVYLACNEGANRIASDPFNQVRVTHKDSGAGPILLITILTKVSSVLNTQQARFRQTPFPLDLL